MTPSRYVLHDLRIALPQGTFSPERQSVSRTNVPDHKPFPWERSAKCEGRTVYVAAGIWLCDPAGGNLHRRYAESPLLSPLLSSAKRTSRTNASIRSADFFPGEASTPLLTSTAQG